jgi:hypothetical protein
VGVDFSIHSATVFNTGSGATHQWQVCVFVEPLPQHHWQLKWRGTIKKVTIDGVHHQAPHVGVRDDAFDTVTEEETLLTQISVWLGCLGEL